METQTAVRTEQEAKKRLENWLFQKRPDYPTIYLDRCKTRCQCGETKGLIIYGESDDHRGAKIAICQACGDDNAFNDEVIKIV